MGNGFLVITLGLAAYVAGFILVVRWLWRQRRIDAQAAADTSYRPGVTILKPLCGADDNLEQNLESFARLTYPRFQLLLAAADETDPALAVARRVAARHPEVDLEIVLGAMAPTGNPKVLNLEALYAHARFDLCLISDSNVLARPNELEFLVSPFRDPDVGLVYQPVIGFGEQTVPAALENFRLTDVSAFLMTYTKTLTGWNVVMGKGMLFRRQALESVGGFECVRQVAAEDYVLGLAIHRAGWKLIMSSLPVRAVHARWSWRGFFNRTLRHAAMRFRLSPYTYPLELCINPVFVAVVCSLIFGLQMLPLLALTAVVKTSLETVMGTILRDQQPRLRYVPLILLKDLLMGAIWLPAIFCRTVTWRGNVMRLGWGTRLSAGVDLPELPATVPAGPHVPATNVRGTTRRRGLTVSPPLR